MKAILTRFIPASNTRGARIRASAEGVAALTIPYPYGESGSFAPFAEAAIKLARRMKWEGTLVPGGLANGDVVFCFANQPQKFRI